MRLVLRLWLVGLGSWLLVSCTKETNITQNSAPNDAAGAGGAAGASGAAGAAGGSGQAGAGPACAAAMQGQGVGAVQVALGASHSCARLADGTAVCWGLANGSGELGNGTVQGSATPARVQGEAGGAPLAGLTDLAAGGATTCAVDCSGAAFCWGNGVLGQIGNGETKEKNLLPARVSGLKGVSKIAIGLSGACAIAGADKAVSCWGSNFAGFVGNGKDELGGPCSNGSENCVPAPSLVAGDTSGSTWLTAGDSFACAISLGVSCWGSNGFGVLTVDPSKTPKSYEATLITTNSLVNVSAGSGHVCGFMPQQGVTCWGANSFGQLAVAPGPPSYKATGFQVQGDFRAVASGTSHTCAVKAGDGTVLCWGLNENGQLGDGTVGGPDDCFGPNCKSAPTTVKGLSDVVQIAAGEAHTCAVTKNGEVHCWGSNFVGQLGATSQLPVACAQGNVCIPEPVRVKLLP